MKIRLAGLLVSAWVALVAPAAQSAVAVAPGSFAPTGSMSAWRLGAAAAPLSGGRVLVAGGESGAAVHFQDLRSAEIFNQASGAFSPTGDLTVPRSFAAAAPLLDGRVLIAGGAGTQSQSAEIFDPATGSFSPTGPMTIARNSPAAAPLPDGRVLVAGGRYFDGSDYMGSLQSAEIFDPATGSFSPTGSMTFARTAAAAAPLPDGRVLVAGGFSDPPGGPGNPQSAEIFDPATGSFSPTGLMIVPRYGDAAAPLPDGRVLIAGGGSPMAEIFDPATGAFSQAKPMTHERFYPAVAPTADGRVLIAGRGTLPPSANSAELFTPGLSHKLRGRKLTATVAVAGTLSSRCHHEAAALFEVNECERRARLDQPQAQANR